MELKTNLLIILFILLFTITPLFSGEDFVRIDQWRHEGRILAPVQELTVDQQGNLVGGFANPKESKLIIRKDKIIQYSQHGKGPSDLEDLCAIFPVDNDLAIVEDQGKVKIFTKKMIRMYGRRQNGFKRIRICFS